MPGCFFGADIYAFGGHVPAQLAALRPGVVLIGHDIWNDAVNIYNSCGTRPWLILRWMDLDVGNPQHTPEAAADLICAKAKALMALGIYCIAHGLNEQHTNRPRARVWELKFIERCHWHGVPTICSCYSYANFDDWEAQDFREVWRESDYNGPHRYDLVLPDGTFKERSETSLRYRKWKGYPMEKDICTEFGIEDGGWQKLDISETMMQERMLENVLLWKGDGGLASTFFCMEHTNPLKWGGYYGVYSQYVFWGKNSPSFEPGGNVPITEDDLTAAQKVIREAFLNVQRRLGGASLERDKQAFEAAGDGYNVTTKQFEELAKKL